MQDVPFPEIEPGSRGFVFAATGARYTILARRAARSLALAVPGARIDLFTDQEIDDPVFEQIHSLPESWHRPKMYAIRNTRFERVIVMDADTQVVADISELFDILDQCDIAGVPGVVRGRGMIPPEEGIPRCAPVINSGVLVLRSGARMRDFALKWEEDMRERGEKLDQPALRRMIYSGEGGLRFLPLGMEYNLKWIQLLFVWSERNGAPHVIHQSRLSTVEPGDPQTPFRLNETVGKEHAVLVRRLLRSDWSLGGRKDTKLPKLRRRLARLVRIRAKKRGPRARTRV